MSFIYTSPYSRNNIYLGGKIDAKSFSTLKRRNILRILNMTPAKEAGITAGVPNYFENNKSGMSIKYKRIPVYDAPTSDLLSYAEEIVNFISSGLHHGSVLVHCQRGVSRSSTAVMFYLIRKTNMTHQQALQLCKRRRAAVDPIPAFCEQLTKYERECRQLGYLTASDEQNIKISEKKRSGPSAESRSSTKEQKTTLGPKLTDTEIIGSKRQKVEASGDTVRRVIGPSTGPSPHHNHVSSLKPKYIGPSIGPSSGPNPANGQSSTRPERPPLDKEIETDAAKPSTEAFHNEGK